MRNTVPKDILPHLKCSSLRRHAFSSPCQHSILRQLIPLSKKHKVKSSLTLKQAWGVTDIAVCSVELPNKHKVQMGTPCKAMQRLEVSVWYKDMLSSLHWGYSNTFYRFIPYASLPSCCSPTPQTSCHSVHRNVVIMVSVLEWSGIHRM